MPEISRPQLAVYVAAAIAIALVGAKYVAGAGGSAPAVRTATASAPVRIEHEAPSAVVVDVAGAVRRPGVYELPPGSRVDDAVRRAGGATARADLAAINLAAPLEDGRQILVPERTPAGGVAAAPGGAAAAPAGGTAAPGAPAVPIDLNTATAEQLDTLDGIGPGIAGDILAYRQEHNGFGSVDELAQVPGIGPARMAALRDHVRV